MILDSFTLAGLLLALAPAVGVVLLTLRRSQP